MYVLNLSSAFPAIIALQFSEQGSGWSVEALCHSVSRPDCGGGGEREEIPELEKKEMRRQRQF
jgi:hypothetical protein